MPQSQRTAVSNEKQEKLVQFQGARFSGHVKMQVGRNSKQRSKQDSSKNSNRAARNQSGERWTTLLEGKK